MMHLSMSMFHVKHPFGQACDVRGNVAGNGTVPVSGVGSGAWYGGGMDDRMQDIGDAKPRMSKRRRFIVVGRWALAAAWAAVVYFGPAVSAPSAVAYFVEFAVLGFLLANALWQHMGLLTACAAAVLITCMLGIADGAVSLMVPDHPFSFFDWLVGAGGALAGGIVAHPALRLIDSFVSSDL